MIATARLGAETAFVTELTGGKADLADYSGDLAGWDRADQPDLCHREPIRAAQCQLQVPRTTVRGRSDDLGMYPEGTQIMP